LQSKDQNHASRLKDGGNDASSRGDRGGLPPGNRHGNDGGRSWHYGLSLGGGSVREALTAGGGGGGDGTKQTLEATSAAEKQKMEQTEADRQKRNIGADDTNAKQRALMKGTASLR
jgi:hypothetical protein